MGSIQEETNLYGGTHHGLTLKQCNADEYHLPARLCAAANVADWKRIDVTERYIKGWLQKDNCYYYIYRYANLAQHHLADLILSPTDWDLDSLLTQVWHADYQPNVQERVRLAALLKPDHPFHHRHC